MCKSYEPDFLLTDETFGSLDSKPGTEIMQLFNKINEVQGKTIVQVTHSTETSRYGNRIIHVKGGRVSGFEKVFSYGIEQIMKES